MNTSYRTLRLARAEADPESVILDDRSPWAAFVDETPPQVLVFRNRLQFVIHPWFNVEEPCFGP
jgi:hypothetical protein